MPAARSPCVVLVALFVTLIPTTIGALLSAIGIAGMDRLVRFNVLAMSGRAVEAAGDVDTLLLDKTGTITLGNRQATEFMPLRRRHRAGAGRRRAARLARPTKRRKAARSSCWPRRNTASAAATWRRLHAKFIPFIGADPHERRRCRRLAPSARARSTPSDSPMALARSAPQRGARFGARSNTRSPSASPSPAARRSRSPRTASCSASSTSRTSSRAASASASPNCARWASAP